MMLGKIPRSILGTLSSRSIFLLQRGRYGGGPHKRLCKRNVPVLVGSKRKSCVSLETLPHPPSTPFLHPLVSLRELLASVYVLGDKTQTRNGNGSEQGCVRGCAGSGRLWFQHMHLAFGNIPPLQPMLRADSKGMIHPDKGAHGSFNAKHLLCKTWETRGKVYFFLIFVKNSLLLPTPHPILHSLDRDFPMRNFVFMT